MFIFLPRISASIAIFMAPTAGSLTGHILFHRALPRTHTGTAHTHTHERGVVGTHTDAIDLACLRPVSRKHNTVLICIVNVIDCN